MAHKTSYFSSLAQAGFQWIAPEKPKQMQQQDYIESMPSNVMKSNEMSQGGLMDRPISPMNPPENMMALPPTPVMQEPLSQSSSPMASAPLAMGGMSGSMPMGINERHGLIIDPYPLSEKEMNAPYKKTSSGASVHKAMNEQAHVANALQLGRNMSTMTKPERVSIKQARMDRPFDPSRSMNAMPGAMIEPAIPQPIYMDAVGFGRDLPLALALSQVVPDDYAFSFADKNAAGMIVSWQGGRPWNEVLDNMLGEQGLRASIQGKKVVISSL